MIRDARSSQESKAVGRRRLFQIRDDYVICDMDVLNLVLYDHGTDKRAF
jgi:hypothetical protein